MTAKRRHGLDPKEHKERKDRSGNRETRKTQNFPAADNRIGQVRVGPVSSLCSGETRNPMNGSTKLNSNRDNCISARLDWPNDSDGGTTPAVFINTAGAIITNVYSRLSPLQRAIGIDETASGNPANTVDTVSRALLAQGWRHIGSEPPPIRRCPRVLPIGPWSCSIPRR
jgi:hypothetical protein